MRTMLWRGLAATGIATSIGALFLPWMQYANCHWGCPAADSPSLGHPVTAWSANSFGFGYGWQKELFVTKVAFLSAVALALVAVCLLNVSTSAKVRSWVVAVLAVAAGLATVSVAAAAVMIPRSNQVSCDQLLNCLAGTGITPAVGWYCALAGGVMLALSAGIAAYPDIVRLSATIQFHQSVLNRVRFFLLPGS